MVDDSSNREPGIRVLPSLLSLCNGGMMVGRAGQDQQSQLLPWQQSVSSVTRKGSDSDMGPGSAIDCGMLKAHLKATVGSGAASILALPRTIGLSAIWGNKRCGRHR